MKKYLPMSFIATNGASPQFVLLLLRHQHHSTSKNLVHDPCSDLTVLQTYLSLSSGSVRCHAFSERTTGILRHGQDNQIRVFHMFFGFGSSFGLAMLPAQTQDWFHDGQVGAQHHHSLRPPSPKGVFLGGRGGRGGGGGSNSLLLSSPPKPQTS